jgi:hypothetical protein
MNETRYAVLIAYDRAIDEEVGDLLNNAGAEYYTKWKDVLGTGRHDPHLGDPVWPGLNNARLVVVDRNTKDRLVREIRSMQETYAAAGLRAFVMPVLEEV